MFFLSKKIKEKKKVDWTFRIKIAVVWLLWFGMTLAIMFNLPNAGGFDRVNNSRSLWLTAFYRN
jgi:hypothetical protein